MLSTNHLMRLYFKLNNCKCLQRVIYWFIVGKEVLQRFSGYKFIFTDVLPSLRFSPIILNFFPLFGRGFVSLVWVFESELLCMEPFVFFSEIYPLLSLISFW